MKEQCTTKNTCGMNKRVLDADSNEPPLASIRDREPSQKDDTSRHVISNFVLPEKHLFGVLIVTMTALAPLCAIRMTGELTARKPVYITLPLNSACEMLGSRENGTSEFRVILCV